MPNKLCTRVLPNKLCTKVLPDKLCTKVLPSKLCTKVLPNKLCTLTNAVCVVLQGITIKPVVNALKVKKQEEIELSVNEKIHETVSTDGILD